MIILPAATFGITLLRNEVVFSPWFERKFKALYERSTPIHRIQRLSTFIFLLRRIVLMILMVALLELESGVRVTVVLLMSLIVSTYAVGVERMETPAETRMHIYNEITIALVCFHVVFFNDFVPDVDA